MGHGLHNLQVRIAMRGLSLLKIGGRMVYCTCSMNPVENEAVVAEVIEFKRGKSEAMKFVKNLIEVEPNEVEWRLVLALCYETMGQLS
ncbi:hypothetical protein RIF29_33658 [Crotalaria pallida]|uniref:SAM-dependent MTase RsmB/NOP-type domain-containing protein n=1 Tax=Crotalaria pallida TaxID=3830 RepID=A0AAN9HU67_CROPI